VSTGLPRLIGILDLVQQRQIIDYKTASSTPNAEKVATLHEIQTSSYAILYRHNTGNNESACSSITWSNSRTPRWSSPHCQP
jgi:hypothetical protein